MADRSNVAHIEGSRVANLPLDSEIPVVPVGSSCVHVDSIEADKSHRGSSGRLRGPRYQRYVLIERQVPSIPGCGLRGSGALSGGQHERNIQSLVHGNVVVNLVVCHAEASTDN